MSLGLILMVLMSLGLHLLCVCVEFGDVFDEFGGAFDEFGRAFDEFGRGFGRGAWR